MKTVGISGYYSSGSSAFVDLLHEFDETQVLDFEFGLVYNLDGLGDLVTNMNRSVAFTSVAIERFKNIALKPFIRGTITEKEMDKFINDFLNEVIQYFWNFGNRDPNNVFNKYLYLLCMKNIRNKHLRHLRDVMIKILHRACRIDIGIRPIVMWEEVEKASKQFVFNVLTAMNIDCNCEKKDVVVINQPFSVRDPISSFKFFENPVAIIVDRDPRDQYLFGKHFLLPKKKTCGFPCGNVDDYIRWFRSSHKSLPDLRREKNVMLLNFEELVYDCENTTKKVADFLGISKQIRKGECFKPTHSVNNTQLFKKYVGCESDIKKIERQLSDYIFPFENYSDIKPEGEMFCGSQNNKNHVHNKYH